MRPRCKHAAALPGSLSRTRLASELASTCRKDLTYDQSHVSSSLQSQTPCNDPPRNKSTTTILIPHRTCHTLATAMMWPYLALSTTCPQDKSATGSPRLANGNLVVGHGRPNRWVYLDPWLGRRDPSIGSAMTQRLGLL
jgi:hypothetical protein